MNATVYNEDGTSDIGANSAIENHWYEYTHSHEKLVSADGQMNGLDFDRQVLFCYLVDGEVFIRKVKDPQSKYGIRFEVLDSLQIDTLYNVESKGGFRVCMGIKIDDHYRPVSYFLRKDTSADYYTAGERIEVPASEIIHVYKKLFPLQVRGYTPLAPVILTLNSLEQYKSAEINASILNSAFMGIWTKQSAGGDAYGDFDREDVDESGDVAIELESNVFRYAPEGYTLQQINNNHPTDHLGVFLKSLLKGVAGALGMSFNKISSDY